MERTASAITHVYGLTETYGPAAVCAKHAEWNALDIGARTERNGRQGGGYTCHGGRPVSGPAALRARGRVLSLGGREDGDGSRDHAGGAVGRRDDGRDHVPRQHHDEGISQESEGDRRSVCRR